ncbi:MAG: glycosyltransferase family 4 protein [Steroidobacteraceae bacterium]
MDEALAARAYVEQWISQSNIEVWNGVAETGEAIGGYTERRRLSEIALAHHVACLNPDIALAASPFEGAGDAAVPLIPGSTPGIPVASIFYDAIPHRFAKKYLTTEQFTSYYYRHLAFYKNFDLNLCISEFSRSEAEEISGNGACVNISAGVSANFLNLLLSGAESNVAVPDAKFVLYIGALDWRKNVITVVDAFDRLPDDLRQEIKFVLAGDHAPWLLANIKARWEELALPPENFVTLGHVSDRDLLKLYKMASLVVQPSLMEGFGLTALEAMMCGAPVIASSAGALPEVIGNPNLMFDPKNPDNIAERIVRVFRDADFTQQMVADGLARAKQFSWEKSAEIAARALSETARRRPSEMPNRSMLRIRTYKALGHSNIPTDFIVETLARAEPLQASSARLLIDATSTVRIDHGTGIQRVVKQITRNLLLQDSQNTAVMYCDDEEGFFKVKIDIESFSPSVDRTKDGKILFRGCDKIVMLDSSWEFYRQHMPLLMSARLRGADVVSCVYDTVPLRFEAMCNPVVPGVFAAWFPCALTYSTAFICISQAVADELHAILEGIRFPRRMRIGFWHLGADFSSTTDHPTVAARSDNRRPSFLMVGTIEMRKGHRLALEAFEALWRQDIDAELVIVGKVGWGVDHLITRLRKHPEAGRRLHWYENVDDDRLADLYAAADAIIAASYTEGFGLPLVEARHFGKPVIASDIPVFREVTEGARCVRLFEVGSSASLASAIRAFLASRSERHSPVVEERPWISWADSARELRDLVLEGKWYRTYEPPEQRPYVSLFDHGDTATKEPLDETGCRNSLELVEGPIPSDGGRVIQYVLRATNLSNKVWSSKGIEGTRNGVFLSYRVLAADGRTLICGDPKFDISFVLIPGDSHYIAIKVPIEAKERGGAFVDAEMIQDGVAWFGNPLRLPL